MTFEKVIAWLLISSKDPRKFSLMIKGALLFVVPYLIHLIDIACRFGLACLGIDTDGFNGIIEHIGDFTFYAMSAFATALTIWGAIRKIYLSYMGENRALDNYG